MVIPAELMLRDSHAGPGPQQALVGEPAEIMMVINAMDIRIIRILTVENMV